MEIRTRITHGLLTRYLDSGAGDTLLLLHGWGSTLATFQKLTNELEWPGRTIAIDLPGFGGTEIPKEPWDVRAYALFVHEFLKALDVTPTVVVGHSLGGRIVIKGVAEGLLQPKKIVFIASAGLAQRTTLRNVAFRALAKIGRAVTAAVPFATFKERLRTGLYELAGSSDYLSAGALRETFKKVVGENLKADTGKIRVPTLLVWGERDSVTPLKEAKLLHASIAGSVLHVVPGATHFAHEEEPRRVAQVIDEFIRQ